MIRRKTKFRTIAEAEKAIGRRVAEYRNIRGWHQEQLAMQVGISRDQLASIEVGRVALTTITALKIAEALQVNLLWLAEGLGNQKRFILPPLEMIKTAQKEKYFKQAFDLVLMLFFYKDAFQCHKESREFYEAAKIKIDQLKTSRTEGRELSAQMMPFKEFADQEMRDFLEVDQDSLSNEDKNKIQQQIGFLKNYLASGDLIPDFNPQKIELTNSSDFRNIRFDMKLARTMKELLEDVRRLAKPAGMKARLAKYLGVPHSRVSEWLADKYEPSGEITLKLIKWVNDPVERQK